MRFALWTLFILILSGAVYANQTQKDDYPKNRRGIIHRYIFKNSEKACSNNEGLWYVVDLTEITGKGERGTFPCNSKYAARCQDETLKEINTGVGHCFLGEMMIEESIEELNE